MRRWVSFLVCLICTHTYAFFYTQISLTAGSTSDTGCVGYLNPIERLQFPGMCFQDAGQGVRATDFVSAWPAGIHMGARYITPSSRQERHSPFSSYHPQSLSWHMKLTKSVGTETYPELEL